MGTTLRKTFSTSGPRTDVRASSGLVSAIRTAVGAIDGVHDVLLLHRNENSQVSKFFVLLNEPSLEVVEQVVRAMIQLEDAFAGDRFDYDTVPKTRAALVPSGAESLLHGQRV